MVAGDRDRRRGHALTGKRNEMVSVRLPPDLAAQTRACASRLGMTLSEFVRRAALGTLPPPPPLIGNGIGVHTRNSAPCKVTYHPPPASDATSCSGVAVTWELVSQ